MNNPPKVTYPSIYIRTFGDKGNHVDIGALMDAQVVSLEQRPGAAQDQCVVRLPSKRLEYFNKVDSLWSILDFDEVLISMGGTMQVFGTARNWIRRWQGNDEIVEFTVLNQDQFHDDAAIGKRYGKWDFTNNTVFSNTKADIPTAKLIFNEGGIPNSNKCETQYGIEGGERTGYRFWGSGNKFDSLAGYWNPISELMYLQSNVYSYGGGYEYTAATQILGTVAETGGWAGTASGANLTYQTAFPELNVDGLTYGKALEKLWEQAGGFQYYMRVSPNSSDTDVRIFRTYPPYTAHQTVKDLYLQSATATVALTANNTQRARINTDNSRRATRIIGMGAPERYVGTVQLHPGWDESLTSDVYSTPGLINRSDKDTYDPKYQDVMRRWIIPRSTHDLNSLFGVTVGNTNVPSPFSTEVHRFLPNINMGYWPNATNEEKRAQLKPLLSYILPGGATPRKIDASYMLLPDALGIYIGGTGPKLQDQVYTAAESGSLSKVYLTAPIESDERLAYSMVDPTVATGSIPNIERAVAYGDSYQYEERALSMGDYSVGGNRRILLQIPGSSGIIATKMDSFAPVDDTAGLTQRVKDEYGFRNTALSYGHVMIPWIESNYAIGDIIGDVAGRDIALNSVVVNRSWNFLNQTTTLQLTDQRYR